MALLPSDNTNHIRGLEKRKERRRRIERLKARVRELELKRQEGVHT